MNSRMAKLITEIPKGENHIHIEGSIPAKTALRLARHNGVALPFDTEQGMYDYIGEKVVDLNSFMACDRLINSVCLHREDYHEVLYDLGREAFEQNIIYQELHLDYPLNEVRGIPLDVVMEGYRSGREAVKQDFGVEIVFIAGLDRTLPPETCLQFVRNLEPYLDMVDALGMDCEEKGYPCILHKPAYRLAREMGLFLTAHAGEDDGAQNIWDAINELGCQRIDHGVRAIDDPELVALLAEKQILLAMCVNSNMNCNLFDSYRNHSIRELTAKGVPCSISSDDPPYVGNLLAEYEAVADKVGFDENQMIALARNSLAHSIKGRHLLPRFDRWVESWRAEMGPV